MLPADPRRFPLQRFTRVAALLAAVVLPTAAHAESHTLLVFETVPELAQRTDPGPKGRAHRDAFAAFGARMQAAGGLRGGSPLVPAAAIAIDSHALGGYFIIEVENRASAEHWPAEAPATLRGGRVIALPVVDSPTMAAKP